MLPCFWSMIFGVHDWLNGRNLPQSGAETLLWEGVFLTLQKQNQGPGGLFFQSMGKRGNIPVMPAYGLFNAWNGYDYLIFVSSPPLFQFVMGLDLNWLFSAGNWWVSDLWCSLMASNHQTSSKIYLGVMGCSINATVFVLFWVSWSLGAVLIYSLSNS